jgi:hypothetical protein
MKLNLLLGLALVLIGIQSNCFGTVDATRIRMEQMATNYGHFSLETVVKNRPLRLLGVMVQPKSGTGGPLVLKHNPLVEEQARLVQELRSLDTNRTALATLLKHPDPKVRTLALGALWQREDGRDLPLLVSLINDPAPTFANLHESMDQAIRFRPVSDFENTQTVGQVARAMLAYWGVPHASRPVQVDFVDGSDAGVTADDFAGYWQKYAGRDYAASWFAFRMKRATRETDPIQPEYRADIDRVMADMRALSSPDGLWIQLYVLAPGNQFTT